MHRPISHQARRGPHRAWVAIVLVALIATACGGSASPPPTYPPGSIVLTAKDRKFSTTELRVPAGVPFTLVFVNEDGDTHNVAIRTKPGFDGDLILRHDPIAASTVILSVGAIPAGTYYFLCEVHPSMTGTVLAN